MTISIHNCFAFPAKRALSLSHGRLAPGGLALGLLLLSSSPAKAHSAYIFAWVDGPQICSESYFSKNSKVRGGEVSMMNAQGDTLAIVVTDPQGLACFPAPGEVQDLTFIVQAGQGHRGEFILPAAEIQDAVRVGEKEESGAVPLSTTLATGRDAETVALNLPARNIDPDYLRTVVREEMQAQLGPIRQALAESKNDTAPRARDIFGGIGWIAGIATLANWLHNRRKKG